MVGIATIALSALIGAFLGYLFRAYEFRRTQRLELYGTFLRSFLDLADAGATLQTVSVQLGDLGAVTEPEAKDLIQKAFASHDSARMAFRESATRLRLIASNRVLSKVDIIEQWVADNIHGAPPFSRDCPPSAGDAFRGAGAVRERSLELARQFAELARRDVEGVPSMRRRR